MDIIEFRKEFEAYISIQPGRIDDADLSYLGKFTYQKLSEIREIINDGLNRKVNSRIEEGVQLTNLLQQLINEHSQDFTQKKRIEELDRIKAEKHKLQNEVWSLKADILNKTVDAADKQVPKWASGFMKVGMTLITSSLAAIGITYASLIEEESVSNITLGAVFILSVLGIISLGRVRPPPAAVMVCNQ